MLDDLGHSPGLSVWSQQVQGVTAEVNDEIGSGADMQKRQHVANHTKAESIIANPHFEEFDILPYSQRQKVFIYPKCPKNLVEQ